MMSIEQERCTAVYGVPTMFIGILDHKLFDKFDFSTLRTGIMAGSPCPVKTMKECVERMNMTRGHHRVRSHGIQPGHDPDPLRRAEPG